MERTKPPKSHEVTAIYSEQEEPIVLSKPLLDTLSKEKHFDRLIALYCFYYYTAKWQRTNQPKCTTEYTAKGMHWTADKVRLTKNQLRELGLIEDIAGRDPDTNQITGHFIKVNFIWMKNPTLPKNPHYGKTHTMENQRGNALSNNNIYPSGKTGIKYNEKNLKYLPLTERLSTIISSNKKIKITSQKIKNWTNSIRQLVEIDEIDPIRIKKALHWYQNHIGEQYCPVIESGQSLRDKFTKLEDAMKRVQVSKFAHLPPFKEYDGRRYHLNPEDGEYYNKAGTKYVE